MREDFKNKYGPWALVTGASAGIGREFARQLAGRGLNIVLVARRQDLLAELAQELESAYSVETRQLVCDLGAGNFMQQLQEATYDLEIGLLVNNAGARSFQGSFLERTPEELEHTCHFSMKVQLLLLHHFGQRMAPRGRGGLIQVSSIRGHMSTPYMAEYSASKAYQLTLGEALHEELKDAGLDVLVVSPGATITERIRVGMPPAQVVETALQQLGRRPSVIPGLRNAWVAVKYRYFNSRSYAVRRAGRWQRRYLALRETDSPFVPPGINNQSETMKT